MARQRTFGHEDPLTGVHLRRATTPTPRQSLQGAFQGTLSR